MHVCTYQHMAVQGCIHICAPHVSAHKCGSTLGGVQLDTDEGLGLNSSKTWTSMQHHNDDTALDVAKFAGAAGLNCSGMRLCQSDSVV